LSPADVENVFRQHAADLNHAGSGPGTRVVAFDGKALKGSFDDFNDVKAKQVLSAFAVNTALVLAHIETDEKSNEILPRWASRPLSQHDRPRQPMYPSGRTRKLASCTP
jgi:hypothetical protein